MKPQHSGSHWERHAESYLHRKGLKTLERNYRCRAGEIDLVMQHQDVLVFVEVRFRASDRYGSGADSVGHFKQSRLIATARSYLQVRRPHPSTTCRFDVVSIGKRFGRTRVDWIPHAFEAA